METVESFVEGMGNNKKGICMYAVIGQKMDYN